MAGPRRISGLQKDVFALYRALLRAARKKESVEVRNSLYNVVRSEFREEANSVDRNDFRSIEHMLRHGYKKKKILEMPGFTGSVTVLGKAPSKVLMVVAFGMVVALCTLRDDD